MKPTEASSSKLLQFRASRVVSLALAALTCLLLSLGAAGTAVAQDNPHGDLSLECSLCHSTAGWTPLKDPLEFVHAETGLSLDNGHADVECVSCHQTLVFGFVPTACADCHDDPHRGELGFDCEVCHSPAGWDNRRSLSDFHSATLFPLTGTHATVDCAGCHRREPPFEYSLTPTDCFSCHFEDYQNTGEPDHVAAGFPTDCQQCHGTVEWEGADFGDGFGFDHSVLFQLTGAHAELDCEECHVNGYSGTPSDCLSCHRAEYNGTSDPNHQQAGFGTDCENCHGTSTWEGAVTDHQSFFPLTGSHRALDCDDCHSDGFAGTPTDCYACHRTDYNSTREPNHQSAGFGTDCEDCHNTTSWAGATVNHQQFWPLTGEHRGLDCEACHANGFAGTPTDCNACHSADYDASSDPDHQEAGFSRDCEECHTTSGWSGATVNHQQFWPLTGEHRGLDCEECHANGTAGTPTDCNACHSTDYDATSDPDHQEAGFSRDCEECHTTSGWSGAAVNHQEFWPLTGQHRNLDCEECHADGYAGTPTDCNACHSADYDGTEDPDHQALGYPRDCEECHDTSDWDGEIVHAFPIYSGAHRKNEAWDRCTDCHPSAGNFNIFDCTACHSRGEMDDEHDDEDGYVYESIECYACHPDGKEDD